MEKFVVMCLVLMMLVSFSGCGDVKTIDGLTYDTYGLINESSKKNPDIEYELIIGNVIWSVILVETAVFPIYFIGFSMYEPVGKKGAKPIGVVQ